MPLVRISLCQGTLAEYRKGLFDGVHRAVVKAITIPPDVVRQAGRSVNGFLMHALFCRKLGFA
jgi:Tautomerase enzyme